MKRPNNGFSLVELLIVVAILAIVVGIGYPSYRNHVMKANRADAKIFLLDIADRQERFYADRGTYTTTITDLGLANANSPKGHYSVALSANPSGDLTVTYQLTATPQGGQTKDKCSSFTLDSMGSQSSSPAGCWD